MPDSSTSLRITRVRPSGAEGAFSTNPFAEVIAGTKQLLQDRPLALTVAGISYFWFLGAFCQMDLLLFGKEMLHASELRSGLLLTGLAIGIGFGSLLAGKWSGDKIELGLVPLGALGMSALLPRPLRSAILLYGLCGGAGSAGRFERPLYRSAECFPAAARGRAAKGPPHRHQ